MPEQKPNAAPPPLRNILLAGSLWMIGLRWVLRLLGVANIAILARLLTPGDFGVVAMATAVVGFSRVFFELGVDYALIRKNDATAMHFNAAWTIRLIQSICLAYLLIFIAPYASTYYEDPRVVPLLGVLAVSIVVQGLTNIGIVTFRKDLEFEKEFKFMVVSKLVSTAVTIAMALTLRSYWALVLGILAAYIIECSLSYAFHAFRPRLTLESGSEIWSFSKWIVILHILNYVTLRFDRILIGGLVPAARLGQYTMGVEVSQMATTELIAPISRAIVPGLAKLQSDAKRLRAAFLKTVGATTIVAFPAAVGLALVAPEVVPLFLGDQWIEAIAIVQIASIHLMMGTLGSAGTNLFLVAGDLSKLITLSAIRAVTFLLLFFPMFEWGGIQGVLYFKVVLATAMSFAVLATVSRIHVIPVRQIIGQIWRPMAGSAAMAACVVLMSASVPDAPMLALMYKTIIGGLIYTITVSTLWWLFGRSDGIESEVQNLILTKLGRSD